MPSLVATSTQGDEVLFRVVALLGTLLQVVYLKLAASPAVLTSPSVAAEYLTLSASQHASGRTSSALEWHQSSIQRNLWRDELVGGGADPAHLQLGPG